MNTGRDMTCNCSHISQCHWVQPFVRGVLACSRFTLCWQWPPGWGAQDKQTNKLTELNGLNESNELNELSELSELNEPNQLSELNQLNELHELNELHLLLIVF